MSDYSLKYYAPITPELNYVLQTIRERGGDYVVYENNNDRTDLKALNADDELYVRYVRRLREQARADTVAEFAKGIHNEAMLHFLDDWKTEYRAELKDSLCADIRAEVIAELRTELNEQDRAALKLEIKDQVYAQVYAELKSQLDATAAAQSLQASAALNASKSIEECVSSEQQLSSSASAKPLAAPQKYEWLEYANYSDSDFANKKLIHSIGPHVYQLERITDKYAAMQAQKQANIMHRERKRVQTKHRFSVPATIAKSKPNDKALTAAEEKKLSEIRDALEYASMMMNEMGESLAPSIQTAQSEEPSKPAKLPNAKLSEAAKADAESQEEEPLVDARDNMDVVPVSNKRELVQTAPEVVQPAKRACIYTNLPKIAQPGSQWKPLQNRTPTPLKQSFKKPIAGAPPKSPALPAPVKPVTPKEPVIQYPEWPNSQENK